MSPTSIDWNKFYSDLMFDIWGSAGYWALNELLWPDATMNTKEGAD